MSRETSILVAWLLLQAPLALLAPAFYQYGNLRDIALSNVPVLIAAIGMTLVILIRHIDISIGAQFAVCAILSGLLAKAGFPMPLVALCILMAGAVLGAFNGLLVGFIRLPSIVVTLAAMAVLRDAIRWLTEGAWVQNLPPAFQWFGLRQSSGEWLIVLVAFILILISGWSLRFLAPGRAVYATGSDSEAARLAGIDTRAVTVSVFVLMGTLTGLAALLDSVRFSSIQSNSGVGFELKVIAAVVVGGTSINGGRGSIYGTVLGVALLGTIGPALVFLGINAFWEKAIQGAIILWAVVIDAVLARVRGPAVAR